jgi:hypothetical protein
MCGMARGVQFLIDSDWLNSQTTITAEKRMGLELEAHCAVVIPMRRPALDAPFDERKTYSDQEFAAFDFLSAALRSDPEKYRANGRPPKLLKMPDGKPKP